MSKSKTTAMAILLAAISMAGGYGIYHLTAPKKPATATVKPAVKPVVTATSAIGQKRVNFSLPDTEGKTRKFSEWDGKVVLLNFWATWCPPCRREMPAFIQLMDKYGKQGFQVVGVAIDRKDPVIDFADGIGVNYPILFGEDTAMEITGDYGNRFGQLPYSVLIDRKGVIRYIHRGELTYKDAEEQLRKLL